jgi:hypothetical protein
MILNKDTKYAKKCFNEILFIKWHNIKQGHGGRSYLKLTLNIRYLMTCLVLFLHVWGVSSKKLL